MDAVKNPAVEAVEQRTDALEKQLVDIDVRLIEQDHRLIAVWRTWWRYRSERPSGDAPQAEKDLWSRRHRASMWAILYRFVSPGAAAAGTVTLLTLGGVWLTHQANQIAEKQAGLMREQNSYLREQNESLRAQIAAQSEETFRVRRAALLGTLYDRVECGKEPCPLRASLRARTEAFLSFLEIERKRLANRKPRFKYDPDSMINLTHLELDRAILHGIDLSYTDLSFSHLEGTFFEQSNLTGTSFFHTDLAGGSLDGSDLSGATFLNADLQGTGLKARLDDVHFDGSDVRGASFAHSGRTATGLTQERLDEVGACDSTTELPADLRCPPGRLPTPNSSEPPLSIQRWRAPR